MIDVVEILQHWHAGRPKLVLSASLGVDPKTVRKYVAPAEAEGIRPGDGLVLDRAGWAAKVAVWFPELVDARARSTTWPLLEAKHELIGATLETNTLATVHQRLRDEHGVRVSDSSLRRYVAQVFPDRNRAAVTVPRPPVPPGEAQIECGRRGGGRVNREPHLESLLRTLKLPGMADMLGERLAQAAAARLGHAELLALLCGDEVARRDAAGLSRRLAAARFESTCAVEDLDFAYNPDLPAGVIRDLATLRFLDHGESVILHGPVGVGKTMLAQALGQLACRRGHTAAFTKTSRLLADLAGGHADHSWANRLRRWARPALLILDDFAMRELSMPQADDLYELITERAGRPVIFTSNRTPTDWYPLFPNPVVAESILDRIVNTAHHIAMPGKSYRPRRRPTTTDAGAR